MPPLALHVVRWPGLARMLTMIVMIISFVFVAGRGRPGVARVVGALETLVSSLLVYVA